ncbi:Transcription antitermination protein RfaH [bioreactor metagenome]|uniref:Transcription antitermination protein RfaH n=1 Tax=bioreactor metagenome TaxID=1076179 RepID=A0A645CET1_9ZZZZ
MGSDNLNWYIIRTKPRKENIVRSAVELRGLPALTPKVHTFRIVNGKKQRVEAFLLSTYVFVQCDNTSTNDLEFIPGSIGLLKHNNIPIYLRSSDIERLHNLCKLNVPPEVCSDFEVGQNVVICNGPLIGVEGEIINSSKQYLYVRSGIQCLTFKVDIRVNEIIVKDSKQIR